MPHEVQSGGPGQRNGGRAMRRYERSLDIIIAFVAVAMGLFHVYTALFGVLTSMWQRSIHLAFGLLIVFFTDSLKQKSTPARALSIVLGALGVSTAVYIISCFDSIIMRFGSPSTLDLAFAALAVLLVLEMARRALGWALPIIAMAFLAYALLGPYLPGILHHRGYDLQRILNQMYLTTEGIYGLPLGVSASYIFLFVLFGSFLLATGAGQFYIDLANALVGTTRGGPAKVAVIASVFFGTVSGSAQANVAGTGMITIPMMKSLGYRPEFAGAVEATASTGGQIMPPVMGAAAFLMAEILGVPYLTIVRAAFIPALIYFVSVFFSVDFEAVKRRIAGLARDRVPDLRKILREGWPHLLPIIVLIMLLVVFRWTTTKAAVYSVLVTVLVGFLRRQSKFGPRRLVDAFRDGAKGAMVVMFCPKLAPAQRVFVVSGDDRDDPILEIPASPGTEFIVKYTHSQTSGPMEMHFKVDPHHRIVLTEIWAKVLRPEIEELVGYAQVVVQHEGWTIYRGIGQRMDPLVLRVRVTPGEHSLVIDGKEIPLLSVANAGDRLHLRVR